MAIWENLPVNDECWVGHKRKGVADPAEQFKSPG